jgi:hypothetical protein
VRTHVFEHDGADWLDRIRRCGRVVGESNERCGMPESNRVHKVPDTSEQQDEHRRRAGDGDDG